MPKILTGNKENPHFKKLRARISHVEEKPGVYRWLNKEGEVLYVGKAVNLRNRLRSYVQPGQKHSAWKDMLVRQIADFNATIVNTDLEAYMLETNLIKELRPKYNIMMKDDKNFVYVRISTDETYPRVEVTRQMIDDGALYFGPKTSAFEVRESLTFLRKLFPYRTCKMDIQPVRLASFDNAQDRSLAQGEPKDPNVSDEILRSAQDKQIPIDVTVKNRDRPTPCLDHHIKQCGAPCIGKVTPKMYREQSINGVIAYFQGKHQEVEKTLMEKMQEAVTLKKFERAAELRDQLGMLKAMQEKQIISDTSRANTDVVGVAIQTGKAFVVLIKERDGKLISEDSFSLQGNADTPGDVLSQFLPQYYATVSDLPDCILLSDDFEEKKIVQEWLSIQRGKKIAVTVPQRGKKSSLMIMAEKNAQWKAQQSEAKWEAETRKVEEALEELQTTLGLSELPKRIEGYDISHLSGTETVGSMTVFVNGKSKREHYRNFTIRTLKEGQVDDYKALAEVLNRRLLHLTRNNKEEEKTWNEKGITFGKARKDDQKDIEKIFDEHPTGFLVRDVNYKDFLVARAEEKIIGFVRLLKHEGLVELQSLWIDKKYRGQKLGQFLARKILYGVKKGKIYVTCPPELEEYYAQLRFRHVITTPKYYIELEKSLREKHPDVKMGGIVMVYDMKDNKADTSLESKPDLLLIDGGKGQLGAVKTVLDRLKLAIPVIGLAKREEEVFIPGQSSAILFPKDSPARFLLQRIRDEAHRVANVHRKKRGWNATVKSALDDVPGIGEKTKKELLDRFGTVANMRGASDDDLKSLLSESQFAALKNIMSAEEMKEDRKNGQD